jgi:hypothetical protein
MLASSLIAFCCRQSGEEAGDLKHNMAQLAADVHSMSSFALLQTLPASASAFAGASAGVRLAVMTRATSGVASLQDGELEVRALAARLYFVHFSGLTLAPSGACCL